jgi:multiple sugar transport system substrate-binding protein
MMKGKKLIAVALIALLALTVGLLTGCSKKGGGTKTINLWFWDQNADEPYTQLIAEFEAANPGIKVVKSLTPWADYWTKLQTALPTGTGPDVFWLNHPNAVTYIPTGNIMDLESFAADIHFENFSNRLSDPFVYQGKRYGIPIFWDTMMLYYNKALFDKAGIAYPDENWTWADYFNAAEKLTIKNGNNTVQYGILVDGSPQAGFPSWVYQNGGKIYSDDRMKLVINNPEAREAIQLQLDAIAKGWAPPVQVARETTAETLFSSGTVAMFPSISINMATYTETLGNNFQVAPLPKQKQRAAIFHNLAYVASAKTKNPEEVKKFMTFLATERHAQAIVNVFMPAYNGYTEKYFSGYSQLDTQAIADSINYGYPLPNAGKNAGAIYSLLDSEMGKIYNNPQLGDSLADLETLINAEIAR